MFNMKVFFSFQFHGRMEGRVNKTVNNILQAGKNKVIQTPNILESLTEDPVFLQNYENGNVYTGSRHSQNQ